MEGAKFKSWKNLHFFRMKVPFSKWRQGRSSFEMRKGLRASSRAARKPLGLMTVGRVIFEGQMHFERCVALGRKYP